MKILQIAPPWIDVPPKGYGGTEWVIYNLVKGLHRKHHQVTLFATKNSLVSTKLEQIYTHGLADMGLPWEAALPPLLHYHQAFKQGHKYDLVHAHLSSQTDLMILPFLADLADAGVPCVMTIHGHLPFDRYSNWDQYYFRLYAPKVRVINISQTMESVTPEGFIKAGVIYNSLDSATITYQPQPGSYLTWLGKIIPEKGLHHAIQVAKQLNEPFVFAGIVDQHQSKSVDYFKTQVEPLIDDDQIRYLGPADLPQKNQLLGGAKAFLNPIDWEEPFGMVMVESMAAGTPVISYPRGAAKEVVVDSQTGFLVQDQNQMAEKIKQIHKISRLACRKHVEQNFSITKAAEDHLKIYKNIIRSATTKSHYQIIPSNTPSPATLI